MKRYWLHIISVGLAFAAGMVAQANREVNVIAQSIQPPASQEVAKEPADEYPDLLEDKYVTGFNGERLDVLESSWAEDPDERLEVINHSEVQPIGENDLLVSYADALYRLNHERRVVWEYRMAQWVIDFELIPSQRLIYVTGGDNLMAILDSRSGNEIYGEGRNGSAAYGVAKQFGDDTCLVTDNFVMYREKFRPHGGEPMADGVACWRGTNKLWHVDFPPDADLVVSGKRIVAVTKSRSAIYVKEFTPPQSLE